VKNESVEKIEKVARGFLIAQAIIFAWFVLTVIFNKSIYAFLSLYGAGGASIAVYLGLLIFVLMTITLIIIEYGVRRR